MSAKQQQIANFVNTCTLHKLDFSIDFSFRFDPLDGEWELLNYETLPDGESDCFIKLCYTDDGFEFRIYDDQDEILYQEPLECLTRLRHLMKDWRANIIDKYKQDDRLG